jgi:hypothetical protein
MKQEVAAWDPDEFLPTVTLNLCTSLLEYSINGLALHCEDYMFD